MADHGVSDGASNGVRAPDMPPPHPASHWHAIDDGRRVTGPGRTAFAPVIRPPSFANGHGAEHRCAEERRWRDALCVEAQQIETAACTWAKLYRGRAGKFHSVSTYLALTSAVVATLAGGTGLRWQATVGAGLALTAAVLAGVSSTLGMRSRTLREQTAAVENTLLGDSARVFRSVTAPYASHEDVVHAFDALHAQRDAVVRAAPIESPRTVRRITAELKALEMQRQQEADRADHTRAGPAQPRPGTAAVSAANGQPAGSAASPPAR